MISMITEKAMIEHIDGLLGYCEHVSDQLSCYVDPDGAHPDDGHIQRIYSTRSLNHLAMSEDMMSLLADESCFRKLSLPESLKMTRKEILGNPGHNVYHMPVESDIRDEIAVQTIERMDSSFRILDNAYDGFMKEYSRTRTYCNIISEILDNERYSISKRVSCMLHEELSMMSFLADVNRVSFCGLYDIISCLNSMDRQLYDMGYMPAGDSFIINLDLDAIIKSSSRMISIKDGSLGAETKDAITELRPYVDEPLIDFIRGVKSSGDVGEDAIYEAIKEELSAHKTIRYGMDLLIEE